MPARSGRFQLTFVSRNVIQETKTMKSFRTHVLLGLLATLAAASSAFSQQQSKLPAFKDVHYGPHERNVLDFWKAESKQPTPLLVSIHGGGFMRGNKCCASAPQR